MSEKIMNAHIPATPKRHAPVGLASGVRNYE